MKVSSFTATVALALCSVVKGSPVASSADQTLGTHVSGGDTYIVLFNNSRPSVSSVSNVLSRIDLHPDHEDVHMVWNGSQLRGFCANMKAHCIDALNGMDDVAIVEKSQTISVSRTQTTSGAPWGLARISSPGDVIFNSTRLQYTYTYDAVNPQTLPGAGADIYSIDTGINTEHVSFGGRAKMIWPNSTGDDMGHGTHTAGTAGARTFGVAFGANVFGLKALDKNGVGQTPTMVDAIQFATRNHRTRSRTPGFVGSVMNLSFSMFRADASLNNPTAMQFAIDAAINAGMHVVVASGNEYLTDSCLTDPASSGGATGRAISVGSVGMKNMLSDFSNTGACTDIYAPGEDIVSTWVTAPNSVKPDSGTSMSAPHVAGIVAYLMVEKPELAKDPVAMKKYLLDTSLKAMIKVPAGKEVPKNDALLLVNNGQNVENGFISRG
ncbi:hypothetical protein FKW77_010698 [Venturia effusa]|uniref:Peptidase S8/S53 domain-containing protein n=1 Tax=Venturia effusa TaxID=50376 RepID=A0A517KY76_9PEZI|nr:hypothetical protein FKW77_010698 [Venturia effusa]